MSKIGKKGVLLVNLGTPDAPVRGAVYRYLKEFLTDPRVIDIPWLSRQLLVNLIIAPFRSKASAKLYKELWTPEGSPIKTFGFRVKNQLQQLLGSDYVVELAMRYQSPSIEAGLTNLLKSNISELIVFPMFPHYASASTGSVLEKVMTLLSKELAIPTVRMISSYHDNSKMLDVFINNARKFDLPSYDHILFSFHGLPQRQMIKADRSNHCLQSPECCQTLGPKNQLCYSAQCHDTALKLAERMNLDKDQYTICFQSRLGNDPWVQPYTQEILKIQSERGSKRLLVFSPAFVADCLETIVEIGIEYQEEFEAMGGEKIDLVPSLNDDPLWIESIADMVRGQEALVAG